MQRISLYPALIEVVASSLILALTINAQEPPIAGDAGTIALLKQAESAAEKITDPDGAASAYWSIGALLSEAKQDAAAITVLASAREFFARGSGIYSAFLEKEGPNWMSLRGQGGDRAARCRLSTAGLISHSIRPWRPGLRGRAPGA